MKLYDAMERGKAKKPVEGREERIEKVRAKLDSRFESKDRVRVSLWLDKETVDAFKAQGMGWQTRMREILKRHVPDYQDGD